MNSATAIIPMLVHIRVCSVFATDTCTTLGIYVALMLVLVLLEGPGPVAKGILTVVCVTGKRVTWLTSVTTAVSVCVPTNRVTSDVGSGVASDVASVTSAGSALASGIRVPDAVKKGLTERAPSIEETAKETGNSNPALSAQVASVSLCRLVSN